MSNTTITLTTKNFNPSKLTLEEPVEIKGKGWSSQLKYDEEYFLIQTSKLYTPFGAKDFNGNELYALTFTLDKKDTKQQELQTMLKTFEDRVEELVRGLKSKKLNKLMFSK